MLTVHASSPLGGRHQFFFLPLLAALALVLPAPGLAGDDRARARDLVRQGDSFFKASRYREALAAYEKARALDPGDVGLLKLVASSRAALYDSSSTDPSNVRHLAQAIDEYKEYLAKEPDDKEAFRGLASAWMLSKQQEDAAISYLKERHARRPSDVETIGMLAMLAERKGDYAESEAWLRKRIAVEPNNPEAYYRFGVSSWSRSYVAPEGGLEPTKRRKILDDGMAQLDRALALNPDYYEAMLYKNLIYREYVKVEPDAAKQAQLKANAEEWQKKALETRGRVMKKARQSP
jgi:tetratricopeptide (TPR) repeat protein